MGDVLERHQSLTNLRQFVNSSVTNTSLLQIGFRKLRDIDFGPGSFIEMTRIEAETLALTDLAISGPGGAYVSKAGADNYREPGTMEYVHSGAEAVYDIGIRAIDEGDGASTIEVILNGVSLETFTLDTTNPGGGNIFRDYVSNAVPLRDGDVLQLVIKANAGEPGRVDYLTLTDTGAPLPPLPLANIVISVT